MMQPQVGLVKLLYGDFHFRSPSWREVGDEVGVGLESSVWVFINEQSEGEAQR